MKERIVERDSNMPLARNRFQSGNLMLPPDKKPTKILALVALGTSLLTSSCVGLASNARPPQTAEVKSQDQGQTVDELIKMLDEYSEHRTKVDIARVLGKLGDRKALPALIRMGNHSDECKRVSEVEIENILSANK